MEKPTPNEDELLAFWIVLETGEEYEYVLRCIKSFKRFGVEEIYSRLSPTVEFKKKFKESDKKWQPS